ncbi:MAG: alpha/beta hydrolase [Leptolyngbya sp. SIOISBB]|nr:alpha/beta hydrolase [Leptolyngbya sp. SIOISBB]
MISDSLWLCANPALKHFEQPLLNQLNRQADVYCWDYSQSPDEPCDLAGAIALLHDYMESLERPIHLLGHGLSGVLAMLYARQYPAKVQSLTLLSVGAEPEISWPSHYYALRNLLPCSRTIVLKQMVRLLFGPQSAKRTARYIRTLTRVLDTELALHSLISRTALILGRVEMPLLVCQGEQDVILDANTQVQWNPVLKSGDRVWRCPEGRHFFHYEHPESTSQAILQFWQQPICQLRSNLIEHTR